MMIALAVFLELAKSCAPTVAPETLAALVSAESRFEPLTIHINGNSEETLHPSTLDEAIAIATELIVVKRRSVDLGLGQINSANLKGLGLTIADSFDPCSNLTAAAAVLQRDYILAAETTPESQVALRTALSDYNTGDPTRGLANGYVAKVEKAASIVVPAIRPPERSPENADPPRSPDRQAWDVFKQSDRSVFADAGPETHPASTEASPATAQGATRDVSTAVGFKASGTELIRASQ